MEILKEALSFQQLICEKNTLFEETMDAVIPDTYPDIACVVSIDTEVLLRDETIQTDRALFSGCVKINVTFEGDGVLHKLPLQLSFAHVEEMRGIEDMVLASISVSKADCKIINSRKCALELTLFSQAKAYKTCQAEICCDVEEKGLEKLQVEKSLDYIKRICKQGFTVLDDLDIDGVVLCVTPTIKLADTKIMPNKLMLRGECCYKIKYLCPDQTIEVKNVKTMFTQIFDIEGLEENTTVSLHMRGCEYDVRLQNQLAVCLTVDAVLYEHGEKKLHCLQDVYHLDYPTRVKRCDVVISCFDTGDSLHLESTEGFSLGCQLKKIIDTTASLHQISESGGKIKAQIWVCISYLSEGGVYYTHKMMHLESEVLEGSYTITDLACEAMATQTGEDTVQIKASVAMTILKNRGEKLSCMEEIQLITDEPKVRDQKAVLILKNVRQSEQLWSLGKEYNTRVEEIIEANHLEAGAAMVENRLLLIPVH